MLYRQLILSNKGIILFNGHYRFSLVPFCLWQQHLKLFILTLLDMVGTAYIVFRLAWGKALQRIAFLYMAYYML